MICVTNRTVTNSKFNKLYSIVFLHVTFTESSQLQVSPHIEHQTLRRGLAADRRCNVEFHWRNQKRGGGANVPAAPKIDENTWFFENKTKMKQFWFWNISFNLHKVRKKIEIREIFGIYIFWEYAPKRSRTPF